METRAAMNDGQKKTGRPARGEKRKEMAFVAFKIDEETQAALDELVEKQRRLTPSWSNQRGLKSAAIRYAILFAAGKIEVS